MTNDSLPLQGARPVFRAPWFFLYISLFCLSYASLYIHKPLAPILNAIILFSSYWILLINNKFYPVVFLIVFSKCLNGFIVFGNSAAYSLFNFLSGYLPLALYLLRNFSVSRCSFEVKLFRKYWLTAIYIIFLLIYMLPSPLTSAQYFFPRVVPMLMLFGTLVFLKGPLQGKELILFFRFLFLTAIFLYFTENYLDLSYDLLASGDVFSKPVEGQSLVLFGIPRMLGPFWDFRIQGIFGVLYLLIAIVSPDYKFKKIDIIIASLAVILSMSRGAMVLWACVILGASLYHSKTLPSVVFRLLGLFLVGVISIVSYSMFGGDEAKKTLSSFNILSEDGNALSQRGGFKDYSINSFFENPLGRGIGFLKSDLIDRNVLVGEVYYKKVSDAFIYIQMAEVGFLGFIFFILSLFELLFKRTMFGLMFLVGFLIQMTGTDVPDMGVHYFVILLLATAFLPERTVLRQE